MVMLVNEAMDEPSKDQKEKQVKLLIFDRMLRCARRGETRAAPRLRIPSTNPLIVSDERRESRRRDSRRLGTREREGRIHWGICLPVRNAVEARGGQDTGTKTRRFCSGLKFLPVLYSTLAFIIDNARSEDWRTRSVVRLKLGGSVREPEARATFWPIARIGRTGWARPVVGVALQPVC